MQFTQRHGYASFTETNQGCLGCSASTSPVLVSLSLFQLDVLDAEDNGHAHILLVGCFCMLGGGAAQGEHQLLGWHMLDLSLTYLAHHELESVVIIITLHVVAAPPGQAQEKVDSTGQKAKRQSRSQ